MPPTRRQLAQLVGGATAATLLSACGGGGATAAGPAKATAPTSGGAPNPLIKPTATGADLTVVLASSEVALGRNRFAIGLLDARNQPVSNGSVALEFFKLNTDGTAQKRADAAAVFRSVGGPTKGIWTAPATFPETGPWGVRATLGVAEGQAARVAQTRFDVIERFSAPGYDQPAVRSVTLTDRDANGDLSRICSNTPPCAFHTQSVADALARAQKPLVLLFATPALCTSAVCAPELQAVTDLHARYAEAADFIHVELYQYPFEQFKVVSAVDEWRLPSDPWTFVIDASGIVRDRFEGAAPLEELEPALRALIG